LVPRNAKIKIYTNLIVPVLLGMIKKIGLGVTENRVMRGIFDLG
jgi:hypothetical protein